MPKDPHDHPHDCPPPHGGPMPAHQPDPPWEAKWAMNQVIDVISLLTRELHEARTQRKHEFEWLQAHMNLATKQDLEKVEHRIMAKLEELVAAATALSTASDSLSIKVDDLVTKVDKLLGTLGSTDLPPEAEAARVALVASKDKVVAQGDRVDAEVLKVDAVLPTPAPAGTPA